MSDKWVNELESTCMIIHDEKSIGTVEIVNIELEIHTLSIFNNLDHLAYFFFSCLGSFKLKYGGIIEGQKFYKN